MPTAKAKAGSKSPKAPVKRRIKAAQPALAAGDVADFARLPELANFLLMARRRDLQMFTEANQKSLAGLQAVVQHQSQTLKDAVSEWTFVVKVLAQSGPREIISRLDELAIATFRLALHNVRELAEMTVRSQAEAYEAVSLRIREDIAEVSAMLERK